MSPEAREPADIDRLGVLGRTSPFILGAAVIVAIVVYLVASLATPTYSSSASVTITAASTPGGSAQDVALASNSIASQYALQVTSDQVVLQAAHSLGVSPSTLRSHTSAGTLQGQNVVQITVQGTKAATARAEANAVATAFIPYVVAQGTKAAGVLQQAVANQVQPLDLQIQALSAAVNAPGTIAPGSAAQTRLSAEEAQLTQLQATRATLTANTALAIASEEPHVALTTAATASTKVAPQPSLYAIVAFIIALLVAAQISLMLARRKQGITA